MMLSSIDEDDADGVYGTGFVNTPSRPMPSEPVLVRSVGTTNVVEFQNRYYAVPQALGSVNFHDPNVGDMPGVRVADDLLEILNELSDETN